MSNPSGRPRPRPRGRGSERGKRRAATACPRDSSWERESRRDGSATSTCSAAPARSEEHTSELQSRPHLVCRLLLEKKKKNKNKKARGCRWRALTRHCVHVIEERVIIAI